MLLFFFFSNFWYKTNQFFFAILGATLPARVQQLIFHWLSRAIGNHDSSLIRVLSLDVCKIRQFKIDAIAIRKILRLYFYFQ